MIQKEELNIYIISASAFQFLAKEPKVKIFTFSINTINHAVKKYTDNDIKISLKKNLQLSYLANYLLIIIFTPMFF